MIKHSFILLLILAITTFTFAANGNQDLLCSSISDDLNAAGGCVDEDGFEDATTSSMSVGMLEIGDKFDSIGVIIVIILGSLILSFLIAQLVLLKLELSKLQKQQK